MGPAQKGDLWSGHRALAWRADHKIVALVDALGNLAHFLLLPGQRHDSVGAEPLLDGIKIGALIAEMGFDNDALRQELDARGATTQQIADLHAGCSPTTRPAVTLNHDDSGLRRRNRSSWIFWM
jgi:transposase